MIRCLISLVILFAFGVDLYAQSRILDSLKNELVEAKRDSNYVKTLIELSIQSRSVDAIEAGEYADQAIELAGEIRFERGLMVAYYHKGVSEFILGNYESVSEPLSRCLKISEKREDLQVQFFVNNVLGITYNKIGQATQAIDVLYSSAALALELGDSLNYAIALNNIGEIHFERKDNSKAVQLFEESFEIIQKFGEPFQIGALHVNLSGAVEDPIKKEKLSREAVSYGLVHELKDVLVYALNSLGTILAENPDSLESAHNYFTNALRTANELGEEFMIAVSNINVGHAKLLEGRLSSAEQHLIEGLNIAEDNNFVEQLEKAYLFLSQLYESRNQPLKSLQYYKLHKNLSDSLYNANFSKQLTDANVRFDTERKEAEITRQQLLIERQTNTRNLIIGGSLGGLVLMSSLFFAVFQRNKRRRRETELALSLEKQRANDIEELSKAKTDLFNNISHELRTPLTMIIGPLQEAEKKIQNVHLKNDVGLALKNSNRLTGLVNEILDLSKLDAGKLELEISEIRLISFLKRVFYAFTSLADSQQIVLRDNLADIKSEYEKPDNLIIKTDVIKLEKILNNLISNAITFSESGSCVELLLDKKQLAKNILSISIKDEGEGIPREEQSKIFDRYYQSSSTKSPSGTGIGLALVKELCQFLDGDIDVKSIQGGGSIFTFHFPTEKSFAESTASEIASESRTLQTFTPILFKGSKPEILIVEDDLQMARYLKNLLSDLYECTVVYNGKQALVHQALNPDPHKLVLFLLLGVGKILIMLRHNSGFPALIRRKITLSIGFIT